MTRRPKYRNTVTWPRGPVLDLWWSLVDQHPDLYGARISESPRHESTRRDHRDWCPMSLWRAV